MNIVHDLTQAHVDYWAEYSEAKIVTFTAPDEQAEGIEPARGIVTPPTCSADLGMTCVRVAWKPDEIDLAHLARGGTLWLSCWGGLPVHNLQVQAP